MKDMEATGIFGEPMLRKALKGQLPSLEVRRRVERVLEKHLGWPPVGQRMLRALEVREYINPDKSRLVLSKLASGPDDEALTVQARATLRRLESHR